MNVKLLPRKIRDSKGFTLIELIVVIAILGVLASVLITIIDPLDKIKSANDAGVISTITQLGKANDSYAASNSNLYPVGTTFATVVANLNAAGETKFSSINGPTGQNYQYVQPAGCAIATPTNCTSYAFYVQLLSKKYTNGNTAPNLSYFVYVNSQTCPKLNQVAAPTLATTCP